LLPHAATRTRQAPSAAALAIVRTHVIARPAALGPCGMREF
jgi:hypothetical protein